MESKFLSYNIDNQLFKTTDKILLTVSGGMDSVFMVYLFLKSGIDFGIAHCNFKLRQEESEKDEQFVRGLAKQNKLPFYTTAFDTKAFAANKGISIQMAARDLRYAWFEKIREENNFDYIATAHHKNDVAETMLINLSKGTGLAGLHGIKAKNDKIIRPLLGFTRKEIEGFIKKNKFDYREDKSNADTKYIRNKIRHKVIPELEKINPSLIETLCQEGQQFLELEEIISQKIEEVKKECVLIDNDLVKINIEKLKSLSPLKTYIYYLIKDFGFNITDVSDIINGLEDQSGKVYYADKYQLLKDRKYLIISSKTEMKAKEYIVNSIADFKELPISIHGSIKSKTNIEISKLNTIAYLDEGKIQFPLVLRKWSKGDIFRPLGMTGNKKISDFFIDEKLSLLEKENTWLLTSNKTICWVVGMRISETYKITTATNNVLLLELK
jgi:tRNA(Ile)-lysidine synthase